MFHKIFIRLNNKYFYTALGFFIWIFLFDNNNLISRYKTRRALNHARDQKEFYNNEITKDLKTIDELMNDSAALERFGREQYLMKKDNEDIFLVVTKNEEER